MKRGPGEDDRYYRGLAAKMVVVIVVVSLTPLMLIAALTRDYFQVAYRQEVVDHLRERLLRHRQHVENFLAERVGAVRLVARSFTLEQLSDEPFLRARLATLQDEYGPSFQDLGVLTDRGTVVSYTRQYPLRESDYSRAPWFRQALAKSYSVSDISRGSGGASRLVIAVRQQADGKTWILKAGIDCATLDSILESARMGSTGFAFLVNEAGEVQTSLPPEEPAGARKDFLELIRSVPATAPDVRVIERESPAGADFIYLMSRLNDGEWVMVYRQSVDEAFSQMFSARRSAIFVFLIGGLSIVLVGIVVSKRMTNRIANAVQEKQILRDQLIQAGQLASLGELAAGVAHEINNPVGIMVQEAGWMQDLMEDDNLSEEATNEFRRSLNKIVIQGKRCRDITGKLLTFARKSDRTTKPSQLNDLINEVVALSEPKAHFNRIKINRSLQPDLPFVHVSPSEMQQVFLNLINNSIDAMGSQGGTIEIVTRQDGAQVVVDVVDNGSGIPPGNLMRIFDPFFTTKPVGKGTGLGLSICYGIVKRFGGDILVDSEVNVGTTFHVYIPLAPQGANP